MSGDTKLEIIRVVESSGLPKKEACAHFDLPVRTYYHWRKRFREKGKAGLHDNSSFKGKS